MALADVFDALTTRRVYKPAFPIEEATRIVVEGRGKHFDPDVVEVYLRHVKEFVEISPPIRRRSVKRRDRRSSPYNGASTACLDLFQRFQGVLVGERLYLLRQPVGPGTVLGL